MVNDKGELQVGQIFKNVKSVGEWLGKDIPTNIQTNTKNSWLKEFNRHCKYHKDGQKFVVDEVFCTIKEKIDGRHGHTKINTKSILYSNYMENIIMDALESNYNIENSYYKIVTNIIPFMTEKFNNCTMNGYKQLGDELKLEKTGLIRTYVLKQQNIVRNHFISTLDRLQKQGYLQYQQGYQVLYNWTASGHTNEAEWINDDSIISQIILAEKCAYDELEMKPSNRLDQKKNNKFKKFVVKMIEDETQIFNYWKAFSIEQGEKFDDYNFTDGIENDYKELSHRYMMQIHKRIMTNKIKNDNISTNNEFFYPYANENSIMKMLKLDELFWKYWDSKQVDTINEVIGCCQLFKYVSEEESINLKNIDDNIEDDDGYVYPF